MNTTNPLDKLQEVMEELFVLCVKSGVPAPDATIYLPRATIVGLYKAKAEKEKGLRMFERFGGPIGDKDEHFDLELNYGSLGTCKLRMFEEWNSVRRNHAWGTLSVAIQAINLLMSIRETMKAPAGLQSMVNPAIIDYKIEEVVKEFKKLKESVINDEKNYPSTEQFPPLGGDVDFGEGGGAGYPGQGQD